MTRLPHRSQWAAKLLRRSVQVWIVLGWLLVIPAWAYLGCPL